MSTFVPGLISPMVRSLLAMKRGACVALGYVFVTLWRADPTMGVLPAVGKKITQFEQTFEAFHSGEYMDRSDKEWEGLIISQLREIFVPLLELIQTQSALLRTQMAPATGALVKCLPLTACHPTGISIKTLPGLRVGYSSEKLSTSLEVSGILLLDALRSSTENSKFDVKVDSLQTAWCLQWADGRLWREIGDEMPSLKYLCELGLSFLNMWN